MCKDTVDDNVVPNCWGSSQMYVSLAQCVGVALAIAQVGADRAML